MAESEAEAEAKAKVVAEVVVKVMAKLLPAWPEVDRQECAEAAKLPPPPKPSASNSCRSLTKAVSSA